MMKIDELEKHLLGNQSTFFVKTSIFYKCDKYEEMTGTERIKLVKKEKLCFNCLKWNHSADKCSSKNGFVQVVQNIIILHYMIVSRKKLIILMSKTQRYAYPRLQNTKQCYFEQLCFWTYFDFQSLQLYENNWKIIQKMICTFHLYFESIKNLVMKYTLNML